MTANAPLPLTQRSFVAAAGLMGAAGVALAAAAAHGGDARELGAASAICLAHAPALLALGLSGGRLRLGALAAILLFAGAGLFSLDMASRHFWGGPVFPMAAPTGGTTAILGWVVLAIGALLPQGR